MFTFTVHFKVHFKVHFNCPLLLYTFTVHFTAHFYGPELVMEALSLLHFRAPGADVIIDEIEILIGDEDAVLV